MGASLNVAETLIVKIGHGRYDTYIGRGDRDGQPNPDGNPYKIGVDGDRARVVAAFETDFRTQIEQDPVYRRAVLDLLGKRLGCFCECSAGTGCPVCAAARARRGYALECHGQIYVNWLEENAE